jgi:hypothetical protein
MARPVAFTHDGIAYKAFPESGCYFGVGAWRGRPYLSFVGMMQDGTWDTDENGQPNTGEVSNMHEAGDVELLEVINAEFGTAFRQSNFAGR